MEEVAESVAAWQRPLAVRPMIASVLLAAGGAGRVVRRSKLSPVVCRGGSVPVLPMQMVDSDQQPDQESAGQDASVELPEIVRKWQSVGEGVAGNIDGAPAQITRRFCHAGDLADVWKIDTTEIVNWDRKAIVERTIVGPRFKDLWNVCTVMSAFYPTKYSRINAAKRALAKMTITGYTSRMHLETKNTNGEISRASRTVCMRLWSSGKANSEKGFPYLLGTQLLGRAVGVENFHSVDERGPEILELAIKDVFKRVTVVLVQCHRSIFFNDDDVVYWYLIQ